MVSEVEPLKGSDVERNYVSVWLRCDALALLKKIAAYESQRTGVTVTRIDAASKIIREAARKRQIPLEPPDALTASREVQNRLRKRRKLNPC